MKETSVDGLTAPNFVLLLRTASATTGRSKHYSLRLIKKNPILVFSKRD
jgi:hypothetical protein